MPLRFCANLNFMFQESSNLLERYVLAAQAGFRGVETAVPYSHSSEELSRVKNKTGLEQILINSYNREKDLGYAAIPGREPEFAESMKRSIEYAKALNCTRIHIMAGTVVEPGQGNHDAYEKNLRHAVSLLEKEDITGLIEPINPYSVPNYYMNDFERALALVQKISSPFLKIQLDLFHLQFLKGNLTRNIEQYLPFVGHIQIAQVPNRNEPDTEGEISYGYIFKLLEKLGYNGWIGLEYKPLTTTEEGLSWLQKHGSS